MKTRQNIILIIFLFFAANLIFSGPAADENFTAKGKIKDKTGKKIQNARVVITRLPDPENNLRQDSLQGEKPTPERYITYTDKTGSWELTIPRTKTILIKVFANTYKTAQKILSLNRAGTEFDRIFIRMERGLAEILWGSFEHIRLYVAPIHQKNLEILVIKKNLAAVDKYLGLKLKPALKNHGHVFTGYILFQNSQYQESKKHFDKAGSKIWYNLMGDFYKKKDQYKPALSFFLKGVTTKKRADSLVSLAEKFADLGDSQNERTCYQVALKDYQEMLRSLNYHWVDKHVEMSNYCIEKLKTKFGYSEKKPAIKKELAEILKKAGQYCKKLDGVAIYYFCFEQKKDKVYLIRKLARAMENPADFFKNYSPLKIKGTRIIDTYKYDIQFIKKKNGIIEENRKLLMENLDNNNPGIPVLSYSIKEPLYGPHTLVGLGWQNLFDYRIIGQEKIFKEDTVVLEAIPRWHSVFNKMSGKIWINKKDGSVLKIEWNYSRVQNRKQLRSMGLILDRKPELKFVSEFAQEKNRLRFPSRCFIVESYTSKEGKRFERLKVDIQYMNYQFFMVSSEVEVHDDY
jgi:tetratricopeptide (TPR) repeat protein